VQIDVQDESVPDLPVPLEPLHGDRHVVEEAEAPAAAGRGVVARRPDEAEAGLLHADLGGLDGAPGGQCRNVVEADPPDVRNVGARVAGGDVLLGRRQGLHKGHPVLDDIEDRFHSPRGRRRVARVGIDKFLAPDHFHRLTSRGEGSSVKAQAAWEENRRNACRSLTPLLAACCLQLPHPMNFICSSSLRVVGERFSAAASAGDNQRASLTSSAARGSPPR